MKLKHNVIKGVFLGFILESKMLYRNRLYKI